MSQPLPTAADSRGLPPIGAILPELPTPGAVALPSTSPERAAPGSLKRRKCHA
jgi:hypothetical protein